jgi:hypothetical protein
LDADTLKRAKELINDLCFSPNRAIADAALERLCNLNYDLREYFQKNIIPDIPRFSRASINEYPCLGYNTTSPAESLNSVLKRNKINVLSSLWQIRAHCSFALSQMRLSNNEIRRTLKKISTDYEVKLKFLLAPKVLEDLAEEIKSADALELTALNNSTFSVTEHITGGRTAIYKTSKEYCECSYEIFAGLPCRHKIKVCKDIFHLNPVEFISPRWWFIPMNNEQLNQEGITIPESVMAESIQLEHHERDRSQIMEEELENESAIVQNPMTSNNSTKSERDLYLELLYKGKTIATLASGSKEAADDASFRMQRIIDSLLRGQEIEEQQFPEQSVVDIHDRHGRRPGRPNKTRLHGHPSSMSSIKAHTRKCRTCGQEGHDARNCQNKHQ